MNNTEFTRRWNTLTPLELKALYRLVIPQKVQDKFGLNDHEVSSVYQKSCEYLLYFRMHKWDKFSKGEELANALSHFTANVLEHMKSLFLITMSSV